ncbi:MAG: hypothetical protein ACRENA_12640 [Vulcanimicrobiaceae bacterium]
MKLLKIFSATTALFALLTLPLVAQAAVGVGVYIGSPPPPAPVYAVPVAPGPRYAWQAGYWVWGPGGYRWIAGRWAVPPHPGYGWVPGYWYRHDRGYVWREGYWSSRERAHWRRDYR